MQTAIAQENAKLRARCEQLQAENAYLKQAFEPMMLRLPDHVGLTPNEQRLVSRLLRTSPEFVVTKDQLYRALYPIDDEVEMKIIDVFLCKARRKLAPLGITIVTTFGRGYSLDADSHAKLKALIVPPAQRVAA